MLNLAPVGATYSGIMRKPEVLAPAGDERSLRAALAAGADAVYFGLDEGWNARARAANFSLEGLPETVRLIHRAGARAYLTLNTLIFEPELPAVERMLTAVAAAGVDAIIVQDPAIALLARSLAPTLEVHASTQMTISSAEGIALAEGLGVTRVVVPRELSVEEIRKLAGATDMELEVFIHGALCVSWSGQCLSSETWGGRSANRGQCAQACRLPYDLHVDGELRDLGDVRYLLSPRDLAGLDSVGELAEIGVHGLKIEGRQKGPEYVATAVLGYRNAVDGTGTPDREAMALSYSRGQSAGFLQGSDHQTLVDGRSPKHRGLLLGEVSWVRGNSVGVKGELHVARPGMGVVFDDGHPEDKDEAGGPIFGLEVAGGETILRFGTPGPDLRRVAAGQRVWLTGDPANTRLAEGLIAQEPSGRHAVDLVVRGAAGAPLEVTASSGRHRAHAISSSALAPARAGGLDPALLADKLGAFGGTAFRLGALDTLGLGEGLHLPVSELKELRRRIAAELLRSVEGQGHELHPGALERLQPLVSGGVPAAPAQLVPLCRTDEQLDAVLATAHPEV
jgi:U32 family peptidase